MRDALIMSGFSKYIPVPEDEYRKFKKQQQEQIQQTQQELQQPATVAALSTAQHEKDRELFTPTTNPEMQEKRYRELVHMINELKRQITTTAYVPPSKPPLTFGNLQAKADNFLNALGPESWNENNELIYEGRAIPQSSKRELTEYAISNWKTKYSNKPPSGGEELRRLIASKNVPSTSLGLGFRSMQDSRTKTAKKQTVPKRLLPNRSVKITFPQQNERIGRELRQIIASETPPRHVGTSRATKQKAPNVQQIEQFLTDSAKFRQLMQ